MAGLNNSSRNKKVAGKAGDVSNETMKSWNERAREITKGWKVENIWNMDETGCLWHGLPKKTLDAKGKQCTGRKKQGKDLHGHFCKCRRGEGRSWPYNYSYFAN